MANTLSFYRTVKRLGVPDSNIILMLADDVACNARNPYPAEVFNNENHNLNVYGTNVEVDYRGHEVTVENFMRVLTGRHDPAVPRAKRMLSDPGSNVLVYISGHGGAEFMKFQDTEELMAADVADAIQQMEVKGRYNELLLVVETCQAATMYNRIRSRNVLAMASSLKGESSYSYLTDTDVGLSLIDRFTYATLDFFERVDIHSDKTLADLVTIYRYDLLESTFAYSTANYPRPLSTVKVTDFFGSVADVHLVQGQPYEYTGRGGGVRLGVGDAVGKSCGGGAPEAVAKAEGSEPSAQGSLARPAGAGKRPPVVPEVCVSDSGSADGAVRSPGARAAVYPLHVMEGAPAQLPLDWVTLSGLAGLLAALVLSALWA